MGEHYFKLEAVIKKDSHEIIFWYFFSFFKPVWFLDSIIL